MEAKGVVAASAPQWISVHVAKPPLYQHVLVFDEGSIGITWRDVEGFVPVHFSDPEHLVPSDIVGIGSDPTHWMPLPPPPRGGD